MGDRGHSGAYVSDLSVGAVAAERMWQHGDAAEAAGSPLWLRYVDAVHQAAPTRAAVIADALVVAAAAAIAGLEGTAPILLAIALPALLHLSRGYAPRSPLETQGFLWYASRMGGLFAVIISTLIVIGYRVGAEREVVLFVAATAAGLVSLRALTWCVLSLARDRGMGLRPTLVVGSGDVARRVVEKLRAYPSAGLLPVGVLSPSGGDDGTGAGVGAAPEDLPEIVARHGIEHLVLIPEGNRDLHISDCLEYCEGLDLDVAMLPPLADLFLNPTHVAQVGGLPLLPIGRLGRTLELGPRPGKRAFDLVVSLVGLAILMPLLLVVAAAIKLTDGGPVLYRQRRVGYGGKTFWILKFRSMTVGADAQLIDLRDRNLSDGLLFKVRDDPRVTPVGRIIRRLSIDELPQLWNVVRGEMSLVGPRPLAVDPEHFGAMDGTRHAAVPGITGYWQVSGGNGLTYQEMVKLDLAYIQSWSLWLDLKLLARTVPALIHRRSPW